MVFIWILSLLVVVHGFTLRETTSFASTNTEWKQWAATNQHTSLIPFSWSTFFETVVYKYDIQYERMIQVKSAVINKKMYRIWKVV